MTTWKSNMGEFNKRSEIAQRKGLEAAARVLQNAVKRNLRGGFTSGDFVTGLSINSVTISEVKRNEEGNWTIRVGTNLLYNLFYEVGHFNIYRRKFTRVEKWRPAFMDSREAMRAAYARVFKAEMDKGKNL